MADSCKLCGLPLCGFPDEPDEFCCHGCARVYDVLKNLDESAGAEYLAAARKLGIIPEADGSRASTREAELPDDPSAIREDRVLVSGLSCPSCSWIIEQILVAQPGVVRAEVDFFSGSGSVSFDLRRTSTDRLAELLGPFGYGLSTMREARRGAASRGLTFRFVVCGILFVNLMSLSVLRYFETLGYLDDVPDFLTWVELLLLLPVLWLGWLPAARRAVGALVAGRPTMDLLISVAVVAAFALSLAALLTGRPDIYFETCAGLVTISLLSRMIEARLRDRAFADLASLMQLRIQRVRAARGAGEAETFLEVAQVEAGTRLCFRAGETVAFDGTVAVGTVLVSEAVLTGEPQPLRKVAGDRVVAGSEVVEGELELEVARRFEETRLFEITESIKRSLGRAERSLRSADRIAAWFVPGVLGFSLAVWLARMALYGLDHALAAEGWFPSVAVLAVACPCAFSLAGVAAITAATGALLKRGLLVKEPAMLERISRVGEVIFDKTGTLTEGRMRVERLVWRRGEAREDLLPQVLAAERGAFHPVAEAIRSHLASLGVTEAAPPETLEDRPGQGRVARFDDSSALRLGARALFEAPFEPEGLAPRHSAVWFGQGVEALGCFIVGDQVRTEAAEAVRRLTGSGLRTAILSGDRQQVCEWVAAELGIPEAQGDTGLDEKVVRVREREAAGMTAFVGDGTNDALAMGEASVSVALARSTDEALTASGVIALGGSLAGLPVLFAAGRKLARVVRGNYAWAFLFNGAFLPVAAAGKLVPLVAMLLMLFSSAAVLLNSLRLRRL